MKGITRKHIISVATGIALIAAMLLFHNGTMADNEGEVKLELSQTYSSVEAGAEGLTSDLEYTLSAENLPVSESKETLKMDLQLPAGISLPEGELSISDNSVKAGETEVIRLRAESGTLGIFGVSREGNHGLTLTASVETAGGEGLQSMTCSVTVLRAALQADENFKEGSISLSAGLAGKTAVQTAALTAQEKETAEEVSTFSAAPAGAEVITPASWLSGFRQNVLWVDNHDEGKIRPAAQSEYLDMVKAEIYFTIEGGTRTLLTEDTMSQLGLSSLPALSISDSGTNGYVLTVPENRFPSEIKITDSYGDYVTKKVKWEFGAPSVEGYTLTEVTTENIADFAGISETGWYYILKCDFTFNIVLRTGDTYTSFDQLKEKVMEEFALSEDSVKTLLKDISPSRITIAGKGKTVEVTVSDRDKYNIDGTRKEFCVAQTPKEKDYGIITGLPEGADGPDESDVLEIRYDNTGTPYSAHSDAVYDGGKLYLSLEGKTDYTAKKVWWDNANTDAQKGLRPGGEFQLWRYRKGASYTTAAPVRDSENKFLTIKLDTSPDSGVPQEISFPRAGTEEVLEKYDPEGYEYVYVVREYLTGGIGYQQIFGEVKENENGTLSVTDTLPEGMTSREDGNKYVYNEGTLSNTTDDQVLTEVTKTWKAAAFQYDLKGVTIELTLQSRPIAVQGDDDEYEWTAVQQKGQSVTVTKEGFSEEDLDAWGTSMLMPKYDEKGRELEYRWIETGVYQNGQTDEDGNLRNLFKADESQLRGTFELLHEGRLITYSCTVDEENSLIENALANTVDYEVTKEWAEGTTPHKVAFYIYQLSFGQSLDNIDLGKPYIRVAVDKETITAIEPDGLPEGLTLGKEKAGESTAKDWNGWIFNLPEFDENGNKYEYMLLEAEFNEDGSLGDPFIPTYTTWRDDGTDNRDYDMDYHTIVVNGQDGNHIMVRKEWIDDSDTGHREPVTIEVYQKGGNEDGSDKLINSVVLSVSNDWHQLVSIGDAVPENVYIVETKAGDSQVTNTETAGKLTGEYSGAYHRYEVTYKDMRVIAGENVYIVTNKRIGTVNLTATKIWNDGGGMLRTELKKALDELSEEKKISLALRLSFTDESKKENRSISGNIVSLGEDTYPILDGQGNAASSVQYVDLSTDTGQMDYCFYNLPKYDENGAVVHYEIEEVWLDAGGNPLETDLNTYLTENLSGYPEDYPELAEMLSEYVSSVETVSYIVNDAPDEGEGSGEDQSLLAQIAAFFTGEDIKPDTQQVNVTNSLTGSKTVFWHKQWADEYVYQNGQRPDIYIDIYQIVHDEDGNMKTELYQSDYRWNYDKAEDEKYTDIVGDNIGNAKTHWHVVLSGLPKYDQYGYEIYYYAVERTKVDASKFDYQDVVYSVDAAYDPGSGSENSTGGMTLIPIGTKNYILTSGPEGSPAYAVNVENVSGKPADGGAYPAKYALIEGGTFSNSLYNTVRLEGQKLWTALPEGYPDTDLPSLKFAVYRKVKESTEDPYQVATLTVTDWASVNVNGTYKFTIEYMGDDQSAEKEDDSREKLPKYNEKGELYEYSLKEIEIIWPGTAYTSVPDDEQTVQPESTSDIQEELSQIFQTTQPEFNTYLATNVYKGVKGSLAVKKHLQLEFDDEGNPKSYPAVKFVLTRYYTSYAGDSARSVKDESFIRTMIWTSEQVKDAYSEQKDAEGTVSGSIVTGIIQFDNLEKYAPNGSEYIYTVTEVKDDFLDGYDTWAEEGNKNASEINVSAAQNVSVENCQVTILENDTVLTPEATFLNKYDNGPAQEKINLTGNKIWKDLDNAFGFRPESITLELYRSADPQPGQNNGIASQEVTGATFEWNKTDGNNWTYTVDKLDRYAPNGMPWKYTVKETTVPEPYQNSRTNVSGRWNSTTNIYEMSDLTNTILTSVPFEKKWTDRSGNPITEDYLGYDLSVIFKLQVKEESTGDSADSTWRDASEYFNDITAMSGYTFTQTRTGRVNAASAWKGTFADLPAVIKSGNQTIRLSYRVVESEVSSGIEDGQTQTITIDKDEKYSVEPAGGLVEGAVFASAGNITTNRLDVVSLTVTKEWKDDAGNIYKTRPQTGRTGYTWETTFVIQRKADTDDAWVNVTDAGGNLLKITLYGNDTQNSVTSGTVTGLPKTDSDGNVYTYRARELEPGTDNIVDEGESYYNGAYDAHYYTDTAVTNKLKTRPPDPDPEIESDSIYATKVWYPENPPEGESARTVKLALQYLVKDQSGWKTLAEVTLDGQADTMTLDMDSEALTYGELDPWTAVWTNLPLKHPDSFWDEAHNTQYRVIEVSHTPSDYIGLTGSEEPAAGTVKIDGKTYRIYTFTNIQPTELNVEKVWIGTAEDNQKPVTAGLYRTTDPEKVGSADEANRVLDDGEQVTLKLDADSQWKGTFDKLPTYNGEGKLYYYYALELTVGDAPAGEAGFSIKYDFGVSRDDDGSFAASGTTKIYNIAETEVTGTKTWLDNSNAYGSRPEDLTLKLERSTDGETWTAVEADPQWSRNGNLWTYTYTRLPKYDIQGREYSYRVTETVPTGYTGLQEGNDFTNTLTNREYSFTVGKKWEDSGSDRPENLTLYLYRQADGSTDAELVTDAVPVWNRNGSTWTAVYSGLDEYSTDGARYTYWAEEAVPDGYDSENIKAYNGETITNVQQGSLTVSKSVWGNRSETDRDFHFRVKITGTSTAGIRAEDINGTYGSSQGIVFIGGEAEFTLKHDESVTFTGLPAGLQYEVTETDAGKDGYTAVIPAGASGTIRPGERSEAAFVNWRHSWPVPELTSVSGTKTWQDDSNASGLRPDSLTLILYRSVKNGTEEIVDVQPSWSKNGNVWTYTYEKLPLKNSSGEQYTYRVEEVVPEGYTGTQNGRDLVNTLKQEKTGDLVVTKIVSGNAPDTGKRFHFTVTLSDSTINGTYGEMEFTDGSAVFTLGHGESIASSGLPAGTEYTVTEKEADRDGWKTRVTGAEGVISEEPGWVIFENMYSEGGSDRPDNSGDGDEPGSPDTGDDSPLIPMAGMLLFAAGGLGAVYGRRKKQSE
ncbi:MAG: Cna B-type domain-containing protein [Emergencia sp.]